MQKTKVTAQKAEMTASETRVTGSEAEITANETKVTSNEVKMTGSEAKVTARKRETPADQNQIIAHEIDTAAVFIDMLDKNPARRAKIGKTGLSQVKLSEGKTLQAAALAAFVARQSAMAAEETGVSAAKKHEIGDRKNFTDFRVFLRQDIKEMGTRTALGLDGKLALDRQTFTTQARASYTEAKKPQWRALLDPEGYTVAVLDGLLADLDALDGLTSTAESAKIVARDATKDRNTSARALRTWVTWVNTRERRGSAPLALQIGGGLPLPVVEEA